MTEDKKLTDDLLIKIKENQPHDLIMDQDYLGTISKGDMIKRFLDALLKRPIKKDKNGKIIPDIQMIALYGEWGSGKTSLMKYIQEQLDKGDAFKTVFFPSWEMEKDDNLSLSLLESIIESEDSVDKTPIKEAFLAIGMGICKGLSAKIGPININFKEVMQSVEEYNKNITNDSALKRIKKFKEEYSNLEKLILKKTKREKLLVCIDDLDRCEPENVLNLLSAIKLFFTFGNQTIFICGLDEKAVDEAVKVKYGDVIKSGEYMEKIFDISFDMPKPNINKMIYHYFEDMPDSVVGVQKFFESMHFTNPRHIKKVLNKYLLLRYYQEIGLDKDGLIPDQNIEFFRYLTLFIIMLYKFNTVESNEFSVIRDYDEKINYWESEWKEKRHIEVSTLHNLNFSDNVNGYSTLSEIYNKYIRYEMLDRVSRSEQLKLELTFIKKMISLFAPYVEAMLDITEPGYCNQFVKKENTKTEIGYAAYFCSYINQNKDILENNSGRLLEEISNSKYRLWNIFNMAERYL